MVSVKQTLPKKVKPKKIEKLAKIEKVKKLKPNKNVIMESSLEKKIEQKVQLKQETLNDNNIKYVMPSESITEKLVISSLKALQQLTEQTKNTNKNTLFEDDTPIFAEINCIKIQNTKGNLKFVLPHSTYASTGMTCLITPDLKKGRKIDHEPSVDHWEEILRNAGVTNVKTVLPMRQLRVEYDQFELKRRLLTQHDFIMVDTRVLNHVSHLLGKMFFKKANMLVPVRLNEKADIKRDIDIGLRTSMLRLSEGPTSVIVVGHTGMTQKALKENILSLVKQLPEKYPGGEANIRSLSIKLPLSLSLPLYITLRPTNALKAPKLKQKVPKHFVVLEDELSTIPGSTVRVAPDGTVHVKRSKEETSDMEEDSDDNIKGADQSEEE